MSTRSFGNVVTLTIVAAGMTMACGCAHKGTAPPPEAPITQTTSSSSARDTSREANRDVVISDDLRRACNADIGSASEAPKFGYDSSDLRAGDRTVLAQIAKCVTTGPLKGRALHLVGRADPRGEQEYNMNLGEHRATSVRKYLVGLGVGDGRMSETSRGALDATGKDEAGWQNDRRVDISLQ